MNAAMTYGGGVSTRRYAGVVSRARARFARELGARAVTHYSHFSVIYFRDGSKARVSNEVAAEVDRLLRS